MQLISPADAAGRVTAALQNAAEATGAGFDYLLHTARRESSLDPTAKASGSSARGLFQFIDQTWLQTLKEDGPKLGLAGAAADVSKTSSGRYVVTDPARRAEILAMRDDPDASALLAGAFTRRNAATLQTALGREPTNGELYAAHFLGAQGAVDLIKLAVEQPTASAADAFPSQASANRAIFYDKGRARSAAEVYAKVAAFSETGAPKTAAAPVALALQSTKDTADYGPFNNGVENDGQAFHSLFKTGRRSPVSAYVSQAWSSFGSAGLVSDVTATRKVAAAGTAGSPATVASVAPSVAGQAAATAQGDVQIPVRVVRTSTIHPAANATHPKISAQVQQPAHAAHPAAGAAAVGAQPAASTSKASVATQKSAAAAFIKAVAQKLNLAPVQNTDIATPTPSPSAASLRLARR